MIWYCSKNKITSLPEGVPGATHKDLSLFHISSNGLTHLPESISKCPALTTIYANANKIEHMPVGLPQMQSLESCNLSNNAIAVLTNEFLERFGEPDNKDGKCTKVSVFLTMLFC